MWKKWNLNVVCCACVYEFSFVVWLSEFTLRLPPSQPCALVGCLVGHITRWCGFSSTLVAFTCVQPMNTHMLKSMEKRRVRFGYIAPTPACWCSWLAGCPFIKSPNFYRDDPLQEAHNRLSLGTAHCPFQ